VIKVITESVEFEAGSVWSIFVANQAPNRRKREVFWVTGQIARKPPSQCPVHEITSLSKTNAQGELHYARRSRRLRDLPQILSSNVDIMSVYIAGNAKGGMVKDVERVST